jgi:sugar/nucleoside kinase (ribokinase family)
MRYLIFGPAYLDLSVTIARPLLDDHTRRIDQSLAATARTGADDGHLHVVSPHGDHLVCPLPAGESGASATYLLGEPILARVLSAAHPPALTGVYPVSSVTPMLGGMGAGYAAALQGILRMPLGGSVGRPDAVGHDVCARLSRLGIRHHPTLYDGWTSDSTLLLLTPSGDKLAIGLRDTLQQWVPTVEDRVAVEQADVLVFCGAPNRFMAEVLAWQPAGLIMCAPAMRNVCDVELPLSSLASQVDYLALNALEWSHAPDQDTMRATIPLITVTDGPRGCQIYQRGAVSAYPAVPHPGPVNTNRAGETFASTFLQVILDRVPGLRTARLITQAVIDAAAAIALRQAARQLDLVEFAFPPDDWRSE